MNKTFLAFVVTLLLSVLASAQPIKVLFVGNSFTYEPGDVSNPALPENFKAIALALQADVQVDAIVKGGQTMKRHFDEGEVAKKLQSTKYDYVILQAQSIEPLELPKCFPDNGGPIGRSEFVEYAKKLITLIQNSGATPVVFAHWTYKKDHSWLQASFPCLKFASNEVHAGKNWYGADLIEYQNLLNEGFTLATEGSASVILSKVGNQWQALMGSELGNVPDAALYQEDNFHPTTVGSFFSAMVLARDILSIDLNPLTKHPADVTEAQFQTMKRVLSVP
ncbi:hypothetical protein [Bdellovibrio sp. HCB274]|uniref:hypothetical protein n=1 Tax=Bdellovibrio sp. HCB274 TaxID=3394361 RepID=UPI0039B620A9